MIRPVRPLSSNPRAKRRLFFDLDGVGAGFDEHYLKHFGKDLRVVGAVTDEELWSNIDGYDGDFFYDLPVIPEALLVFKEFKAMGYDPIILTACPKENYKYIADQKHDWTREKFDEDQLVIPIVGGKNKARLVQWAGDVLVDDFIKNITAWEEAGGTGVWHQGDWAATKARVHELMQAV